MKTVTLKVGAKGERTAVAVPCQLAETLEDMQKLARNKIEVVIRMFNRGFRIESQERSGARESFRAGDPIEVIAKKVADYDPTVVQPRTTGPRPPKIVTVPKGKKSFTADEVAAMLAAAGIKATVQAAAE